MISPCMQNSPMKDLRCTVLLPPSGNFLMFNETACSEVSHCQIQLQNLWALHRNIASSALAHLWYPVDALTSTGKHACVLLSLFSFTLWMSHKFCPRLLLSSHNLHFRLSAPQISFNFFLYQNQRGHKL